MPTAVPPAASAGWLGRASAVARDIKLSHSVFALPFALLAVFLATGWAGRLPGWAEGTLIVLCMVLARTVAMAVNRWADAAVDAQNPRTAGRAIPSGRVSAELMLGVAIGSAIGFFAAASGFWLLSGNLWPMVLSPVVLAYLALYSFSKRCTWACHLVLGGALGISPLAGVIAVQPGYLAEPTAWLLGLLVVCWVAGFDVIYALQDVGADRRLGLFSLPAVFGPERALWASRALHAAAVILLLAVQAGSVQLGPWFTAAALATIGLLVLEHALVWRSAERHLDTAFFTVNGVISVLLGAGGIADVWQRLTG